MKSANIGIYIRGYMEGLVIHRHSTMAAAIAFRALFSAIPFIVLFSLGYHWVQTQWFWSMQQAPLVTIDMNWAKDLAKLKMSSIEWAYQQPGLWIIAVGLLIYGASTVFRELTAAFELIWEVKATRIWKEKLGRKLVAIALVLGLALILAIALFGSWFLDSVAQNLGMNEEVLGLLLGTISRALLPVLTFSLFICIYIFIPKVKIRFRQVWFGALTATVLFWFGQSAMGWFLGMVDLNSAYGAVGSLILFLWWCYYTALIVLMGAELTRVRYNRDHGERGKIKAAV